MPPKAKFTRQEIIDAAVDIARRAPLEAVTAQELASVLAPPHARCSPISARWRKSVPP